MDESGFHHNQVYSSKGMDQSQVEKYFDFLLDSPLAQVALAWFPGSGKGVLTGRANIHTTADRIPNLWKEVGHINDTPTLHTTINQTDGEGRKRGNIQYPRALCLDIDNPLAYSKYARIVQTYEPQLVVRSSPKKYHFYWKLSPEIDLESWEMLQLGIAQLLGGDLNLRQRTSMIRVPGFQRLTKDGKQFTPDIIHRGERKSLSYSQALEVFPGILNAAKNATKELDKLRQAARKAAKAARGGKITPEDIEILELQGRNTSLYRSLQEYVRKIPWEVPLDKEDIGEAATQINTSFTEPLEDLEVEEIITKILYKREEYEENKKQSLANLLEVQGSFTSEDDDERKLKDSLPIDGEDDENRQNISLTTKQTSLPKRKDEREQRNSRKRGTNTESGKATKRTRKGSRLSGQGRKAPKKSDTEPTTTKPANKTKKLRSRRGNPKPKAPRPSIPRHLKGAAQAFAKALFQKDPDKVTQVLCASVELGNYEQIGDYVCDRFDLVGSFTVSGVSVSLEEQSYWGSPVYYGKKIQKEQFLAFAERLINELQFKILKSDAHKHLLKKPIKSATLTRMATTMYKVALTFPVRRRQSEDLIVFQNGTFQVSSGVFTPDWFAPVKYSHPIWACFCEETAEHYKQGNTKKIKVKKFIKYLDDWFPRDPETIKVILRWFGYCLTTETRTQTFSFFYGPTSAGKGSICQVLRGLVGHENYVSIDYNVLDGGFKAAEMHDSLVIVIDEVEGTQGDHNARLAQLKKLTGGERILIERKYQLPFEDSLCGKFILVSNEAPKYQDKGGAVQRRMLALGFERSYQGIDALAPSQVILEYEADQVATLSALAWSCHINDAKPFHIKKSRALAVGRTEVIEAMNTIDKCIRRFIALEEGTEITSKVLHDLCNFVAQEADIDIGRTLEKKLKTELLARFPEVEYCKNIQTHDGVKRGYKGLTIDLDAFYEQYPEVEDDISNLAGFPDLVKETMNPESNILELGERE